MTEQKATNVHWHDGEISQTDEIIYLAKRAQLFGLRGYPAVEKAPLQLH